MNWTTSKTDASKGKKKKLATGGGVTSRRDSCGPRRPNKPPTWMWYVVLACARKVASLTTNGLRQVISARPPRPPLYTPTTVENWAATLAVTTALTAGVNAYHTVLCDEAPPEQEDGGSPASMLAAEMSTTSLNGRAEMTVALAKASFDKGCC